MSEEFDLISAQNDDVSVSACPSFSENEENFGRVWTYYMRLENNSGEPITLLKKEIYSTDEYGRTEIKSSLGFNGELPWLNAGEYFEFEDSVNINTNSVALYGYCTAITSDGKELKINFPVISLSSPAEISKRFVC